MDLIGMEYLSLEGETRSLFDGLCFIFEWAKGRAILGYAGHPVQFLNALIGSGRHSAPSMRPCHAKKI
ncbi:hypothetical protein AMTR_s00014p00252320 [Amborella trichopoda]|uniref:Uncharacterized protein n=1 Tax=Amborella trichopoda TaxID=13333 RepID=W1PN56_AMBTC|nr:hypothetical protein AMTR_s00014p00252320 [Amborella trichopoda]